MTSATFLVIYWLLFYTSHASHHAHLLDLVTFIRLQLFFDLKSIRFGFVQVLAVYLSQAYC